MAWCEGSTADDICPSSFVSLTVSPLAHLVKVLAILICLYINANILEDPAASSFRVELLRRWRQQVPHNIDACLPNYAAPHTNGYEEYPLHCERVGKCLILFSLTCVSETAFSSYALVM
jgi:hypothetical protein